MKRLILFLLLLYINRVCAQTEQPTLIIDFSKIETNQDSITKNYRIKNIVNSDSTSYKNGLSDCTCDIKEEGNQFIFQNGLAYIPYKGENGIISKVNKNDFILVSIIRKKALMKILIKSDRLIGIDQYLKLDNLSFVEGIFFYDMNDKSNKAEMVTTLDFSNIQSYRIAGNKFDK